ncbi:MULTISPECIES: YkvA family protein [Pacificimonas]|uniref:DUF1232 domain-containing protein n=1 Tax=Pacificimonas aurantium TaxID=1250540 RepID=A0ABS7WND6_9SPHN|nr:MULTISPECIES: YkvA family protein [Pacificimonas]MBZ6379917.1 DUF1232 domain-containing protein [Pacificimonas aurantium]
MLDRLKGWAGRLRASLLALWLARRTAGVPRRAKLLAVLVTGYALSPIDLIPDVIPILGYADDLLVVPLGIWLAIRMIPQPVWARLRKEAETASAPPASRIAAALVVSCWAAAALYAGWRLAG